MSRTFMAVCVLLAAGLAGCRGSGEGTDEAFQPAVVGSDQAAIYIYRQSGRGSGTAEVYVDQEHAGRLRSGEYMVRIVEPGEHFIRVDSRGTMARAVELEAGESAFVSVTMQRRSTPFVDVPQPDEARRIIAGSKKVEPKADPAAPATPGRT